MRHELGNSHYDSRYGQYETHLAARLQFPNGRHNHESVEDTLFIGKRRQDPFEATAYPLHIMDIEGELTKYPYYRRKRVKIAEGFVASDGSDGPSYYKRPKTPYKPRKNYSNMGTINSHVPTEVIRVRNLTRVREQLAALVETVSLVIGTHPSENGNGHTNGHEVEIPVPVQKE